MPYASDAQRRLMEGVRHGWKPSHMKNPPSRAVAKKFHDADRMRGEHKRMKKGMQ